MADVAALVRLAHNNLNARPLRFAVSMDPEHADAINAAQKALESACYARDKAAEAVADETAPKRKLSEKSPLTIAKQQVAECQKALADAEKAAEDTTIVLVFRRFPDAVFRAERKKHTDKDGAWLPGGFDAFAAEWAEKCFDHVETIDGERDEALDALTWEVLVEDTLTTADIEAVSLACLTYQRESIAVPFDPRTRSGRATS